MLPQPQPCWPTEQCKILLIMPGRADMFPVQFVKFLRLKSRCQDFVSTSRQVYFLVAQGGFWYTKCKPGTSSPPSFFCPGVGSRLKASKLDLAGSGRSVSHLSTVPTTPHGLGGVAKARRSGELLRHLHPNGLGHRKLKLQELS